MFNEISDILREKLRSYPLNDKIIFNQKEIGIDPTRFEQITPNQVSPTSSPKIIFIDGGQADILSAGNFCLSFIRLGAVTFQGNKKTSIEKKEFFLLTTATSSSSSAEPPSSTKSLSPSATLAIQQQGTESKEIYYESRIFGDRLIEEQDLFFSSNDVTIKSGVERAPISKITSIARRFAELSFASQLASSGDMILLDGTLEKTFRNEEKYLQKLPLHCHSLAKSSSLFTLSGNSPVVMLNKISPAGSWSYSVDGNTYFVKLHPTSKHVFRFEGNKEALPFIIENSSDPTFLGYPYGLILADQLFRVSQEEKKSLQAKFLLDQKNREIINYFSSSDAHSILDKLQW